MDSNATIAEKLLEEVRNFGRNNVGTWFDYERYKKIFHDQGLFGYESQIADALNL